MPDRSWFATVDWRVHVWVKPVYPPSLAGNLHRMADLALCYIAFRTSPATSSLEVKFIDFDWGGLEGEAKYPAFLSPEISWPLKDPVGQSITQDHDVFMLKAGLQQLQERREDGQDNRKRKR
jgi:hypothetical protein